MDFVTLVESIVDIEEDLLSDVRLDLYSALAEAGGEIRGDVLRIANKYYQPYVQIDWLNRVLAIDVRCLEERRPTTSNETAMKSFGIVHTIRLTVDKRLSIDTDRLIERVKSIYRAAYISLENAYVASYSKWISELFLDLYTLVNTQLDIEGLTHLRDRFWFSVTALKQNTFRYHFSVENLQQAISWLKNAESPVLSPVEAVTMLLTQEVPDGSYGAPKPQAVVEYNAGTRILEFAALPTLGTKTSFWLAERTLFASNSLTALQIATIEGDAYDINFPVEHLREISNAVYAIKDDLIKVATNRHNKFRRDQRRLRSAIARVQKASGQIGSAAIDLGLELTAKVIADLISKQ